MKSSLFLSTASQRGLLSAVGWQWSSTSYVQAAGNQYAEQLLPLLGTLFFKDSRVEGIRPSSWGRRIASRGWLVIFVPFVAQTISALLLVGLVSLCDIYLAERFGDLWSR